MAFKYTENVGYGFNNFVQFIFGLFWRVIAYTCLCYCNRNKMGMKSPIQKLQIFLSRYAPIEKEDMSELSETTKSVFSFLTSQLNKWCTFICTVCCNIYNAITEATLKRKNFDLGDPDADGPAYTDNSLRDESYHRGDSWWSDVGQSLYAGDIDSSDASKKGKKSK